MKERLQKVVAYTTLCSTGYILASVIDKNVPQNTIPRKTLVFSGWIVMTAVISDVLTAHTNEMIDKAFDTYNTHLNS